MRISDWSSDVCSSDLVEVTRDMPAPERGGDVRTDQPVVDAKRLPLDIDESEARQDASRQLFRAKALLRRPGAVVPLSAIPLPEGTANLRAHRLDRDKLHNCQIRRPCGRTTTVSATKPSCGEGKRAERNVAWGTATARSWN